MSERYSTHVESEASAWASRMDRGLSAAERDALERWLSEDAGHAGCLEQYVGLSDQLDAALPALVRSGAVAMPEAAAGGTGFGRVWIWTGGLAAAAGLALVLSTWSPPRAEAVRVDSAERRTVALDDGTRAEVNARTDLAVRMSASERRVRLTAGEATFSVARDPSRPFIVETPGGTIRDIGTVFNVRMQSSGRLEVTVLEGSVRVQPADSAAEAVALVAGQQMTLVSPERRVRDLEPAAVADVVAWQQGGVVFDGVPLRTALARFAQYNGIPASAAPDAAELRLGGRFSLQDVDGFLSALEAALPVRVERTADGSVRVSARPADPR